MKSHILILFVLSLLVSTVHVQAQVAYPRFQKHQVLEGETAQTIADKFQVSLSEFCMLNDFPENVKLKYGQVVLVRQLKEGEEEIVEDPLPLKKESTKTKSTVKEEMIADKEEPISKKEEAITKKTETSVRSEKPKTPASTEKTKSAEEQFVVPPPSTKAVEIGPGGTKYNVSKGEYHIVQKGQTFFRIALIYGMSVDELKELNGLSSTTIEIGQKLKVRKD